LGKEKKEYFEFFFQIQSSNQRKEIFLLENIHEKKSWGDLIGKTNPFLPD
jgi:hypothetical protein